MGEIYGYGCISSVKIKRTEPEQLKNTKAYQSLKKQFDRMMLSEDRLFIDLIIASYRVRKKLNYILSTAGFGDCIVITSILALGTSVQEITTNYKKIYEKNIGLLIPDYSKMDNDNLDPLSTCDWSMCLPEHLMFDGEKYPDEITEKIKQIQKVKIKTNNGRKTKERPENFITIYWLYENYFLSKDNTYKNKLISISNKAFERLAAEYEREPSYYNDLLEQEEKYKISTKPKRYGKVPDDFPEFLELINTGTPLEEASKMMNYQTMNDINLKRYKLKYTGGKKAMAQANELRKTELAISLTKDIIND